MLKPNVHGRPAVSEPGKSLHEFGAAVDIAIGGADRPSEQRINDLARMAGLWRPYTKDDVHFQLIGDTLAQYQATIVGQSPINLLLEDASGRRLGFDPSTGEVVNDFGENAFYSGPGSEPQILEIPLGSVIAGSFEVSGIGTGDGPYTIRSFLYGDDPTITLEERVLQTGVAAAGVVLPSIQTTLLPGTSILSDLTGNGFVDFEDLTVLLANWNKEVGADAGNLVNADTTPVNFEDLTVLLADWTGPGPAGSPEAALGDNAVPEPSTLLLALLATLGLSFYRRRRRRAF